VTKNGGVSNKVAGMGRHGTRKKGYEEVLENASVGEKGRRGSAQKKRTTATKGSSRMVNSRGKKK